ncbi:MAG TPA: IclR family transcriptional regulator [Pseudonocardia sp.]
MHIDSTTGYGLMNTAERNTLSSALRVLDGLQVIAKARGPVPLAKLAAELDISEVAAFRVASTLIAGGYVRQAASGGGYAMTWQIVEMSRALLDRTDLRKIAEDRLSALADHYTECITVAIPDGDHVVFIDRINGDLNVHFFCDIGKRLPLHVGAASRAILAYAPQPLIGEYLTRPLARYTVATQVDPALVEQDLAHIRDVGYAVSIGDVEIGISAVAAPILNARSEVLGAAAIANIGARWSDKDVLERGERMAAVCAEISRDCAELTQAFRLNRERPSKR